jgi:upstream activation factor subunit UAF30
MALSEPLAALLGESVLSRPQCVKKIWQYVKERDLQDPADKRQIRCDDRMRAVFKSDRVHMFTMNKVLATQLYPYEEEEDDATAAAAAATAAVNGAHMPPPQEGGGYGVEV